MRAIHIGSRRQIFRAFCTNKAKVTVPQPEDVIVVSPYIKTDPSLVVDVAKENIVKSKPEDYYKSRITVEVQGSAVIENQEDEAVDPTKEVPEKDKAFVTKKTTLKEKLYVMMIHLKESFMAFFRDCGFLWRAARKNGLKDEDYSLFELRERRRIVFDFIKFIPYSAMIIIPGGELIFPIYILLFPNSTPTRFIPINSLGERREILSKKQTEGYNMFVQSIPRFTNLLDIDSTTLYKSLSNLQNSQGKEKDWQYYQASDIEAKLVAFLDSPDKRNSESAFSLGNLSAYELEQLNKVFFMIYIPGYNLLNIVFSAIFKTPFYAARYFAKWRKIPNSTRFTDNILCKFSFRMNRAPLSFIKKHLLLFQLRYHMWQLRKQDRALAKDFSQLEKLEQVHLIEYAKQRAIDIGDKSEIISFVKTYWLPLSLRKDIPIDLLIWIAVLRYKYAEILV